MSEQPPLFAPAYAEAVDPRTCVDRMPGTPDAPCICDPDRKDSCGFPFCEWHEMAEQ